MCVSSTCNTATSALLRRSKPLQHHMSDDPFKSVFSFLHRVRAHLLIKQLLVWLSAFQELFAVKHSMFIVQMTADIPVTQQQNIMYLEDTCCQ